MPTPVENTDVIEASVVIKVSIYQLFLFEEETYKHNLNHRGRPTDRFSATHLPDTIF